MSRIILDVVDSDWNADSPTSAASIEDSVIEDMKIIRNDPYLPKEMEVVGYVYDVFSGKTTEVAVM